jgi:predicted nucleotide-binding protein (sugar kinase/HSP70/actin superfamily)
MSIRVGIPRCLLYYQYGAIWEEFLKELGAEVVVSGATTRATLDSGSVLDEVCLPVKVALGHVQEIMEQVDYLFIPRIVSVAEGQYTCPKIIGIPDLLRTNIAGLPPIIDINVNLRQNRRSLYKAVVEAGRMLGKGPVRSLYAWHRAARRLRPAEDSGGDSERRRIALIGHPYIIHDPQVSMDVLNRLKHLEMDVVTSEMVADGEAEAAAQGLHKKMFWTYSHRMLGAALALMQEPRPVEGLIFMTSFSCGPDALTAELIDQHAQSRSIPYMLLTVDEHTAEAGLITRLEAFTDMLKRRWAHC